MPKVNNSTYLNAKDETIYFNIRIYNFANYVESVYAYLERFNLEYLGTKGKQHSTLVGALSAWYFKDVESVQGCRSNMYGEDFVIVYSNKYKVENGNVIFNELIFASVVDVIEYKNESFDYNRRIK